MRRFNRSRSLVDRFEPVVRANPAPCFEYNTWRYRPAERGSAGYPFYANVSPVFEQRLARSGALNRRRFREPPIRFE